MRITTDISNSEFCKSTNYLSTSIIIGRYTFSQTLNEISNSQDLAIIFKLNEMSVSVCITSLDASRNIQQF